MFCTRCGSQLRDEDKFCSACGAATGCSTFAARPVEPLSRPMDQAKIAGVCAGFARYLGVDVTVVRVLWVVLSICPFPVLGVLAYVVAWIVMPKDPVTSVQVRTADRPVV